MRRTLSFLGLTATIIAISATAWAGGWAMTSLDDTPGELVAGETYHIGYTILQHGRFPVSVERTEVRLYGGPWKAGLHVFEGVADGPAGHYVAEVTVPTSGTYKWEVTQGGFGSQDLGTLEVASAAATVAGSSHAGSVLAVLRVALPLLALLAAGYLVILRTGMRRAPLAA